MKSYSWKASDPISKLEIKTTIEGADKAVLHPNPNVPAGPLVTLSDDLRSAGMKADVVLGSGGVPTLQISGFKDADSLLEVIERSGKIVNSRDRKEEGLHASRAVASSAERGHSR